MFVTTTCLDWQPLLLRDCIKERAVERLFSDHLSYGAILHAFAIMSNHMHFVSRMPEQKTVSWFMQRLKSNLSRDLLPLLTQKELDLVQHQTGLDRRRFFMRSFNSIVLRNSETFRQKVQYVHMNPVRAGLVEFPHQYRWSSMSMYEDGRWIEESGLGLADQPIGIEVSRNS